MHVSIRGHELGKGCDESKGGDGGKEMTASCQATITSRGDIANAKEGDGRPELGVLKVSLLSRRNRKILVITLRELVLGGGSRTEVPYVRLDDRGVLRCAGGGGRERGFETKKSWREIARHGQRFFGNQKKAGPAGQWFHKVQKACSSMHAMWGKGVGRKVDVWRRGPPTGGCTA